MAKHYDKEKDGFYPSLQGLLFMLGKMILIFFSENSIEVMSKKRVKSMALLL
jgi:hypothetical protein